MLFNNTNETRLMLVYNAKKYLKLKYLYTYQFLY